MKKFAIIGLGAFGIRMLEELEKMSAEVTIIDQNKSLVEKYKSKASSAYVIEEINEVALRKFLSSKTQTVIVDFSRKMELSTLATTILKKIGIENIVVKAFSDEHGKLLQAVGATQIIYPDREAAKRTTPILAAELLFKFMPISENLALAEVGVSSKYAGKSLIEANLRQDWGVNIVARRKTDSSDFVFMDDPNYKLENDDVLLIVASETHIFEFSGEKINTKKEKSVKPSVFKNLFSSKTGEENIND